MKKTSTITIARRSSYIGCGYDTADRTIANVDKCSRNGQSNVVKSPWGRIRMYESTDTHGRRFSVSGSTVIHNGGNYKFSTIRDRIEAVA